MTLDFVGFSGETLHGVVQEPLDKIRAGRLTRESVGIRILLPDTSAPMALPCRADDLADDPAFRERASSITLRHTQAIVDSMNELAELGLVKDASAEVRIHRCAPLFKLYVVNGEEAFFGFYPVAKHTVSIKGEPHTVYDLMGTDTTLFHHAVTDDKNSTASQYIEGGPPMVRQHVDHR